MSFTINIRSRKEKVVRASVSKRRMTYLLTILLILSIVFSSAPTLAEDEVGVVKGTILIDRYGYVHVDLSTIPVYNGNKTLFIGVYTNLTDLLVRMEGDHPSIIPFNSKVAQAIIEGSGSFLTFVYSISVKTLIEDKEYMHQLKIESRETPERGAYFDVYLSFYGLIDEKTEEDFTNVLATGMSEQGISVESFNLTVKPLFELEENVSFGLIEVVASYYTPNPPASAYVIGIYLQLS